MCMRANCECPHHSALLVLFILSPLRSWPLMASSYASFDPDWLFKLSFRFKGTAFEVLLFWQFASFVSFASCFYSSIIISYSYSPDDWPPDNFCSDPSPPLAALGLARREDGFNLSGIFSNFEASCDP